MTPHTETNAEAIERLKKLAVEYTNILEMRILVDTPFIVEVGALTVTTDDNGIIKTHNTAYPTEFTDKAVKQIQECTFRDGSSQIIKPVVFRRKAWYRQQLESINMVVKHLG